MSDITSSERVKQNKVIRVFVSSTFKDMQAERDELVKRIFPQLRKKCEQRGIVWGEVDLRWGITDEARAEGKVLPICLEEIKRCRPFFIGILGERYGWVPDTIPGELIQQEPWLAEHLQKSITELEILHGVLRNPEMAEHAFFYFRDPAYVEALIKGLPPERRADFLSEDQAAREKLARLKDCIRQSGFPVRENYADPEELGRLVLDDFTRIIESFPVDPLDSMTLEAREHEAFARSRAQVYIGREEYFRRLDEHVEENGPPLVVLGEAGVGKSALLANWALQHQTTQFQSETFRKPSLWSKFKGLFRSVAPLSKQPLILFHFIGSTADSTDWMRMLRRLMAELKQAFKIRTEIPDKPEELRLAFANFLSMAAVKGRVVLILDALNQLEDKDGAPDLVWLPPMIPENIRLILATLPGRSMDELKRRNWLSNSLTVEPLNEVERLEYIRKYLAQYTKALSEVDANLLAAQPQCANPLYLRTLLEELRIYGDHETLRQCRDHYLEANSLLELYDKVLARWEKDYERERPGLVGTAMTLLWAARRGLTEAELLVLLGQNNNPLPGAYWSPLFLAAEASLVNRGGLLGFSHDFMRQAVQQRYLANPELQRGAHVRLAEYFEDQDLSFRQIDELPWQLAQARLWDKLYALLSKETFFIKSFENNEFDVKSYWKSIEAQSAYRMIAAYHDQISNPENYDQRFLWHLMKIFNDTGHIQEAFKLSEFLRELWEKTGDLEHLLNLLNNQAVILIEKGQLSDALALLQQLENQSRASGNYYLLQSSLGNQGLILTKMGRLDAAWNKHKEEERICRKIGYNAGLAACFGNQAAILKIKGELKTAMRLLTKQERIFRELGDRSGLSASLGNQALIQRRWGDINLALSLHKEEEQICRDIGDKKGLAASMGNQAIILMTLGQKQDALELAKQQEIICREQGNQEGLAQALSHQGAILRDEGEYQSALILHQEVEQICRQLNDSFGLIRCLGNQAVIHIDLGNLDKAMEILEEQEKLSRESKDMEGLRVALENQAIIHRRRNNHETALAILQELEKLTVDPEDKIGSLAYLDNKAQTLIRKGELQQAMALLEQQESISLKIGHMWFLHKTYGHQAEIHWEWRNYDRALELFRKKEDICRRIGDKGGVAIALINQAQILCKIGRSQEGVPLAQEAYEMALKYLPEKVHGFKIVLDYLIHSYYDK